MSLLLRLTDRYCFYRLLLQSHFLLYRLHLILLELRGLAARHPWDYFIGSVHYVSDAWAIDDPQKLSEWKHRDAGRSLVSLFRPADHGRRNRLF